MKSDHNGSSVKLFFWIRHILMVLLGCFFLIFGVHILISSYTLNDPFSFVLTFFASNLIILISAALVLVFIYRMKTFYIGSRQKRPPDQPE